MIMIMIMLWHWDNDTIRKCKMNLSHLKYSHVSKGWSQPDAPDIFFMTLSAQSTLVTVLSHYIFFLNWIPGAHPVEMLLLHICLHFSFVESEISNFQPNVRKAFFHLPLIWKQRGMEDETSLSNVQYINDFFNDCEESKELRVLCTECLEIQ